MQKKIEAKATFVIPSLNMRFEVINQTREQLLKIRELINAEGFVNILLEGNKVI